MAYTAKLTRGANRSYFSLDFRHPVKKDRSGRFGLKVRRGLGTDDEEKASQLLAEMNALLADETFHRPTARDQALEHFSRVVVDAFFRDIEPVATSRVADRERLLPLPTASDGYSTALLLGPTGSGKSTVARQFLGTDPDEERFPSTAPGRTTVADQEFILRPTGDFEAVVSFLPPDLVFARVEDALADAALTHLQGRKPADVARALLAPREGRFRLSYILGALPRPVAEHVDGGPGILVGDEPVTAGTATARASRVLEFVERAIEIAENVGGRVAGERNALLVDLLDSSDRDSVEQDVDEALRDAPAFSQLVDDIIDEIGLRFVGISNGDFEGRAGDWPLTWRVTMPESRRSEFILALRPFTGIAAPQHGSLLTPLVEGVRIAGPFQPEWWTDSEPLRLILIDGEGVGHNPETLRSLPGSVTDRIDLVDRVLLVDSATQPMLEGPALVARTLERLGQSAKLLICFTHVDAMRNAENLPTLTDKTAHVRDAAREVFHHLARELGKPHLPELERAVEERSFFVAGIDARVGEDEKLTPDERSDARFTRQELHRLASALRYSPPQPAANTRPIYDLDNLVIAITTAATEYIETYRALLRLPSQRALRGVAWQTAKAATRYTSQFGADGYGPLRPAADFSMILGERLARFLGTPIDFEPVNCTDDAKEMATARVRQALAKRLDHWIRERLLARPLPLWVRAYDHRGPGSTRLRALDIDVLNVSAVPPSSETGDREATQFRAAVKQIVVDSIRDGGGLLHGELNAAASATNG